MNPADVFFLRQQLQHFLLLKERLYGIVLDTGRQFNLLFHLIDRMKFQQCADIQLARINHAKRQIIHRAVHHKLIGFLDAFHMYRFRKRNIALQAADTARFRTFI